MNTNSVEVSMDDVLAIPKPWAIGRGEEVAINENGRQAMTLLLGLHESFDEKAAARAVQADDRRACLLEIIKGIDKFKAEHEDHSCVPGFSPEMLCIMMSLYKLHCEGILEEMAARN